MEKLKVGKKHQQILLDHNIDPRSLTDDEIIKKVSDLLNWYDSFTKMFAMLISRYSYNKKEDEIVLEYIKEHKQLISENARLNTSPELVVDILINKVHIYKKEKV